MGFPNAQFLLFAALLLVSLDGVRACTNFLVTPGASTDGQSIITYNADSHTLYGCLYHYPAQDWPNGTMLDVYDWDGGEYLGQIPQVPHTYNVVGNMNEYQVTIGETTYGGRPELCKGQKDAVLDYGSLIWITLQRSKTAREAIKVMTELVAKYGYVSEGETFSIADPNEVFVMDFIGKGNFGLGAVWVARKVPDGYVCAHANQARITTFPQDDKENVIFATDLISFARERGYFKGDDKDFSFVDAYSPITFEAARWCEIRVWSFFKDLQDGFEDKYFSYVRGTDLTNRMPLFIKPNHKISTLEMMNHTRDHLEGTWFDMTKDWGAEPFRVPYRIHPLSFKVSGVEYVNERPTGTQQTGFTFVATMRSWLPRQVGGVIFFGVDDSATTVYVPMYCCMTEVPRPYKEDFASIEEFKFDSAFWIFNMLANFAYQRYDIVFPEIWAKILEMETTFMSEATAIEKVAVMKINQGQIAQAIEYLTKYSVDSGEYTVQTWQELYGKIFSKYFDGDVRNKNPHGKYPIVTYPGYPQEWYDEIVSKTGDHFRHY